MASLICNYRYTYGSGNTPNREIHFYGDGVKVEAEAFGKMKGQWHKISTISEANMTKEGTSMSEKIDIMMKARLSGSDAVYPPAQPFTKISYQEKFDTIKNLQPTGDYRMTIQNDMESNPYFEVPKSLIFYNPS